MSIVIDSSVALTWCFEDETSPEADMLFERVCDDEAVIPAFWHLELANVFCSQRSAAASQRARSLRGWNCL